MDKLRAMEVFVVTVEAGSFTAAADALKLSAVMVGKYIGALEVQLGGRLLERTTRRHRLTELGRAYLACCRDVLSSVQAADGVAEVLQAVPQGTIRVTAPVAYGAHRLAPIIGDYLQACPQVKIDLALHDRVVDLADEGFDCAIRMGVIDDQSLIARPLKPSRMLAAASPGWLSRHGMPEHPTDLAAHPLLSFAAWGSQPVWRFRRGDEVVAVSVQGSFRSNNGQALLSAAVAGVGVIVQIDALLAPAIAAAQIVPVLPDWELPTRAVHIVRLPDRRPTAKLRSFVDFVVERLG